MDLLRLLYSPKGTVDISHYGIVFLINIIIAISIYFTLFFLRTATHIDNNDTYLIFLFVFGILNFIISTTFAQIKRFRDLGMSPFCILGLAIPILNVVIYFLLFFVEGESNKDLETNG